MQKTEFPFEIIVHDDASTDGTADIIREYEAAHPDLFAVSTARKHLPQGSKILEHYVFPLARGKYVLSAKGRLLDDAG
jgi:glycosyltransferase involved in cell wall biosynthesis